MLLNHVWHILVAPVAYPLLLYVELISCTIHDHVLFKKIDFKIYK